MSYDERLPVGHYEGSWWQDSEEDREEFLTDAFRSIVEFDHVRRHLHAQDGFFAEWAFSEECLALGHVQPEDLEDDYNDDPYVETGEHVGGWNGDVLCRATRYGTACTTCEGECDYDVRLYLLWSLPGVHIA